MIPEKLRAAAVIARRDFVAVIFSKTFLLFLLGPLFPLVVGGMAGAIGAQVDKELNQPQVGLALPAEQTRRLLAAHAALADALPGDVPDFVALDAHDTNPRALLAKHLPGHEGVLSAVVSGTLDHPVLTATPERAHLWQGMIALFAARARDDHPAPLPPSPSTKWPPARPRSKAGKS
jgi:ABC-2 type transport system permease protein